MSSSTNAFISRVADSLRTPTGHLVLVGVASTAITAGSIVAAQALRRATRRSRLKSFVDEATEEEEDAGEEEELADFTRPVGTRQNSLAGASQRTARGAEARKRKGKGTSEVIVREALARNYAFFGEEKMADIREKFVVVVGLGGVGSAAAVMLVRSGIKKIRIIDFDQVSLSSLNVRSRRPLPSVQQ
jgi:FlaA1/EpsC-like NDP-sugar epimerase